MWPRARGRAECQAGAGRASGAPVGRGAARRASRMVSHDTPRRRLTRLGGHLVGVSRSAASTAVKVGEGEGGRKGGPRTAATARIAVVGLGWWATAHHLPDLEKNPAAVFAAAVDPVAERREQVSQKYGVPTFDTVESMEASGIKLDGVIVASAHVAHFANSLACVQAGWPVLVEKPMVVTAAEASRLLAAANTAGVEVSVNNTANFNAATDEAAELVSSGRLGEVKHVVCLMAGDLQDLFSGQTDLFATSPHQSDEPDGAINISPLASTWADPLRAGGYGWGQMSHSLAWAFNVSQLQPAKVFAMDGKSATGVDLWDAAAIRCTNGATMAVSGAGGAINHGQGHAGAGTFVQIFGTKGTMTYEGGGVVVSLRPDKTEEASTFKLPASSSPSSPSPIRRQAGVWRFVERCRGVVAADVHNSASGAIGHAVVAALQGIYTSAKTGQPFTI